jgi:hypothetical protein
MRGSATSFSYIFGYLTSESMQQRQDKGVRSNCRPMMIQAEVSWV